MGLAVVLSSSCGQTACTGTSCRVFWIVENQTDVSKTKSKVLKRKANTKKKKRKEMGKNSCAKRCFGCVWACWVLMLVLFVPRKNSKVIWVRPLSVLMGQQLPFPSRSQGPSTNSFYTPTGKNVNESNNKPLYLTKPFVDLSVWSQLIRETTFFLFLFLFCLCVCLLPVFGEKGVVVLLNWCVLFDSQSGNECKTISASRVLCFYI